MSSRPVISPLGAADQAEIARALPTGGPPGVAHQALVTVRGRRLCVNAASRPSGDLGEPTFSAVVARRSEARADRLLPVIAEGCHDDCHWVAYEFGSAIPLASDGWRRWSAAAALDLIADVADALDDAGAHGVLAYELLPASIFVDPRLGPLLGDFGTAREAFGNPPVEHERGSGFVPPEVLSAHGAGARSGVFASGALLYALLSGGPPRSAPVTHWRADLADGIDLVVARAMARDPLERYRTAAELCDSARRALAEQFAAPVEERLRPAPRALPHPAPNVARSVAPSPVSEPTLLRSVPPGDFVWRPPEPRFLRPLRAALLLAAVALGAFAGLQLGAPDAPATDAGAEVVGDGIRMTLPRGWSPGVPRADVALSAYPSSDWFSGLSVRIRDSGFALGDRSDPVRLGSLDMWRDRSRAPAVIRYVAPTTAGTLVISCEAASGAAPGMMRLCERAVSTVRLESGVALPLPGVVDEPGIRAAVTRLGKDRTAGRRRLAHARRPGAQREAATALASAYGQSARRLAGVPESRAVAAAAQRTAAAYRELAAAAGSGKTRRWKAARDAVRRSEAALAARLGAGG